MAEVKVSVIIPVYNTEKYLRECLDSVLNQTLREIEIICVDDGSTDNSLEILKEYQKKDERITIFTQENSGAAVARNKALDLSKGAFIVFMDPDDYYPDRDVLFSLYDTISKHNYLIVGGSLVLNIDGSGYQPKYEIKDERVFNKDGLIKYQDYQYDFYYQRFMYSKELLNNSSIRFPLYRRGQDVPFFVKAMLAAKSFYALNKKTYCYRVRHKDINWQNNCVAVDAIKATIDIIEIAEKNNLFKLLERCHQRLIRYSKEIIACNKNIEVIEFLNRTLGKIESKKIQEEKQALLSGLDFLIKLEGAKKAREVQVMAGNGRNAKVSVIVPVYNVEKYLPECLGSICNQTLQDLEIICVNDGSLDNSLEILKRYAAIDERIVVLSQENGGLSVARNTGIANANGKYIYFCDSDDKIALTAMEELYTRAEKDNLDILYFDAEAFFEDEELEKQFASYKTYYKRNKDYPGVYTGKNLFNELLKNKDYFPSACLNFINRNFINKNNLIFKTGILHEDNLYSFKAALLSQRAGYLQKILFYRRVRENSIVTQNLNFNHVYGYFITAVEAIEFLKLMELNEDETNSVNNLIYSWINNAKNLLKKINKKEINKINLLNTYEKILFSIYIYNKNAEHQQSINQSVWDKLNKVIPYYQTHGLKNTLWKIKEEISKILR